MTERVELTPSQKRREIFYNRVTLAAQDYVQDLKAQNLLQGTFDDSYFFYDKPRRTAPFTDAMKDFYQLFLDYFKQIKDESWEKDMKLKDAKILAELSESGDESVETTEEEEDDEEWNTED